MYEKSHPRHHKAITAERESKRNSKPISRLPESIQVKSSAVMGCAGFCERRSRKSRVDRTAETRTEAQATVPTILSFVRLEDPAILSQRPVAKEKPVENGPRKRRKNN